MATNPTVTPAPSPIVNTVAPVTPADQDATHVDLTPEEQIAHLEDAKATLSNSSAATSAGSIVHESIKKIEHVLKSMRPHKKVDSQPVAVKPTTPPTPPPLVPAAGQDGVPIIPPQPK